MRIPQRPATYEINTAVWLRELGTQAGTEALRLDHVPDTV